MPKLAVALLTLALALPLQAAPPVPPDDTPRRVAAAEKLLDLFNMDQTYDQAMQQAMQMAVSMIDGQDLPPEEKVNARKAVEASMTVSMEKFSWKNMKGIFVEIYSDILSLEELRGLIAFYESPIGQKFLKKQPQLSLATMAKMQLLMKEMMPDLQKAVDEAIQLDAVIEFGGE
ncbi:MAG: DUF2059 domain-containing protein [Verrucomicrobia bacterium]|jgi:uncharacterized protein|nr:DUF2059 domain-containing protein [Verrucomicrobiota bacterium]MBT7069077.1 DUF2059 domain-containing protein [Verrucomicrobiota bacterium]MBT7700536.1 DUF2059 domain-containing protein [Verrucomicrobiota bacterium]